MSIISLGKVRLLCMLLAVLALGRPAYAQNLTGQIDGRVRDESGGTIPNARITAVHQGTNRTHEAFTSDAGRFSIPNAPLGLYRIEAEAEGFQRVAVADIAVEVGSVATVSLELPVGVASFSVTVETEQAQSSINLVDSEIGEVVDNTQILELPLNGRNAVELALQQAGVYYERTNQGQGDKFFVHGQRHRAVNFTLDGIDTQDNLNRASSTLIDLPLVPMAAENVQEFRVVTGLASAEFSRGGAQVTAVTRSGSNDLHGSLFHFHRNTVLNANDFFNNATGVERPPLIRNQFGGRLGGPIVKDRTFFYFGYQQTREARSIAVNRTVYTPQARAGVFRYLDGMRNTPENVAANPGLVRSVNLMDCGPETTASLSRDCVDGRFQGARPASIDPFIQNDVFGLIPPANNFDLGDGLNTGGFRFNSPSRTTEHLPSFRLDHRLNDVHSFAGTINYVDRNIRGDFNNGREPRYPGQIPLGSRVTHSKAFSGSLTSTFTPTFLNEFRFGFLGAENAFLVTQPFPTPYTLNMNTITDPYDSNDGDEVRDNEVFHVRDSFSWVRGKHQFKAGGEWRQRTVDTYNFDLVNPFGEIDFDDNDYAPGFSNGDLGSLGGGSVNTIDAETARDLMNNLVGAMETVRQRFNVASLGSGFVPNLPERRIYRNRELDLFVQDSWFVRSDLTLNLGLRWEYSSVPVETQGLALAPEGGLDAVFGVSGREGFFNPRTFTGTPCDALSNLPGEVTTANARALIAGCATQYTPTTAVNGRPLWDDDFNNFGPVIGFAWDPFGDGKTSIRSGFRVSYIQDSFSIVDGNLDDNEGLVVTEACVPSDGDCANNPTGGPFLLRDLGGSPVLPETPAFGLPTSRSILNSNAADFRVFDPKLATSYYTEWTFSVARELAAEVALEVRYIGNRGVKLRRMADFNEINIDAVDPTSGQTFLQSFNIARANLDCNRSTGNGNRFDDATGADCITPNPLMATLIAGEPARLRGRFNLLDALQFGEPGHFANQLTQSEFSRPASGQGRLRGGSFWGQVLAGRLPANFFMANPFVASARGMVADGFSTYHALEIEARRRFADGLAFQTNYTFGKALSDFDGDQNTLVNSTRPSSIRNPRYTLQQFMPRHQFNANWFYELPIGPGKAFEPRSSFARGLATGWQVGGLMNWRSGAPLSIHSGRGAFHSRFISDENTVDLSQSMTNGDLRNLVRRQDIGSGVFWIDPCTSAIVGGNCSGGGVQGLFQVPEAGRLGALPQTPVYGPSRFVLDFNVVKRTPITETANVEFRWEIFNLFNNITFAQPENDIFSSNFGQVTQTISNPRLMQFALKVNF